MKVTNTFLYLGTCAFLMLIFSPYIILYFAPSSLYISTALVVLEENAYKISEHMRGEMYRRDGGLLLSKSPYKNGNHNVFWWNCESLESLHILSNRYNVVEYQVRSASTTRSVKDKDEQGFGEEGITYELVNNDVSSQLNVYLPYISEFAREKYQTICLSAYDKKTYASISAINIVENSIHHGYLYWVLLRCRGIHSRKTDVKYHEKETKRYGPIIGSVQIIHSDLKQCIYKCALNIFCVGYNYENNKYCSLLSAINFKAKLTVSISGVIYENYRYDVIDGQEHSSNGVVVLADNLNSKIIVDRSFILKPHVKQKWFVLFHMMTKLQITNFLQSLGGGIWSHSQTQNIILCLPKTYFGSNIKLTMTTIADRFQIKLIDSVDASGMGGGLKPQ